MNSGTLKLTGWRAVAILVLLLLVAGYRFTRARSALEGQGREALEAWVVGELQAPILADATLPLEEKAEALQRMASVTISSLGARGPLDDMVVRVELEPSPDLPPDVELVRYYRMRYSTLVGWSHKGPATPVSYWLAFI